jgi:hypothetical protein
MTLTEEIERMDAAQKALARELREWQAQLHVAEPKAPEPIIFVCAWCQPELTGKNSPPNATHGMCPDCRRKLEEGK